MPRTPKLLAAASSAVLLAGGPAVLATSQPAQASTSASSLPSIHPHFFPAFTDTPAQRQALNPPAPPCPSQVNNAVNSVSGALPVTPVVNCHAPELPATGAPVPGNMAYYGGPVQTAPKVYLVYWGWGQAGAFKQACSPETLTEGSISATLACDPQGAGKRMADFVQQINGTHWAQVQTQYYQVVNGVQTNVGQPTLAGIWADDTDTNPFTTTDSSAQPNTVYAQMAAEVDRARAHFGITDLTNSNIVIAQPSGHSDPVAAAQGYCAFHDNTQPSLAPYYQGVTAGMVWTNMPYVVDQGAGCGADMVNSSANGGALDGVTIALGHEIEEAATDPGAEDVFPDGTMIGGWYDVADSDENGDKCAYVWDDQITDPSGIPAPGGASNITGSGGGQFPVQSLWSNNSAGGAGYCAGTANDLPF